MEYVVGSIAALLSGNVTPNRPKLLKNAKTPMKHQPSPNVTPKSEFVEDRSIFLSPTLQKKKAIAKKSPKRIFQNEDLDITNGEDNNSSLLSPKVQKVKKHLKDELGDDSSAPTILLSPMSPKNKHISPKKGNKKRLIEDIYNDETSFQKKRLKSETENNESVIVNGENILKTEAAENSPKKKKNKKERNDSTIEEMDISADLPKDMNTITSNVESPKKTKKKQTKLKRKQNIHLDLDTTEAEINGIENNSQVGGFVTNTDVAEPQASIKKKKKNKTKKLKQNNEQIQSQVDINNDNKSENIDNQSFKGKKNKNKHSKQNSGKVDLKNNVTSYSVTDFKVTNSENISENIVKNQKLHNNKNKNKKPKQNNNLVESTINATSKAVSNSEVDSKNTKKKNKKKKKSENNKNNNQNEHEYDEKFEVNPNAVTNKDTDSEHDSDDEIESENEEENKKALNPDPADDSSDDEEEEKTKKKSKKENLEKNIGPRSSEDDSKRELFVGNVPFRPKCKKDIRKIFDKYGQIETIRIRSIPLKDARSTPKVAVITGELHPERTTVNVYVKFKSALSVPKALVENNTVLNGCHLRVQPSEWSGVPEDTKCSIFVGNIPFIVEDEEFRKKFEKCGEIESVRIIRDSATRIGKGFGYVNFKTKDAVELALSMADEDLAIKDRLLRVKRCNLKPKQSQARPPQMKRKHNLQTDRKVDGGLQDSGKKENFRRQDQGNNARNFSKGNFGGRQNSFGNDENLRWHNQGNNAGNFRKGNFGGKQNNFGKQETIRRQDQGNRAGNFSKGNFGGRQNNIGGRGHFNRQDQGNNKAGNFGGGKFDGQGDDTVTGAYRRIMNKRKSQDSGEGPPNKKRTLDQPPKQKKERKEFVGMTAEKKKKKKFNKDLKRKKSLSEILTK